MTDCVRIGYMRGGEYRGVDIAGARIKQDYLSMPAQLFYDMYVRPAFDQLFNIPN